MSELINVAIDYPDKELLSDDANWRKFCSLWPLAKEDMDRTTAHWNYGIELGPARITHEEANGLSTMGLRVILKPLPGAMIVKMQDRHKWEHRVGVTPDDLTSGRAVQIAIPDIGLLQIKDVCVEEDCCTDFLQQRLNEGWRILAVCPPNAARRPDYILGRTKAPD